MLYGIVFPCSRTSVETLRRAFNKAACLCLSAAVADVGRNQNGLHAKTAYRNGNTTGADNVESICAIRLHRAVQVRYFESTTVQLLISLLVFFNSSSFSYVLASQLGWQILISR